jgi:hypothetical protein
MIDDDSCHTPVSVLYDVSYILLHPEKINDSTDEQHHARSHGDHEHFIIQGILNNAYLNPSIIPVSGFKLTIHLYPSGTILVPNAIGLQTSRSVTGQERCNENP